MRKSSLGVVIAAVLLGATVTTPAFASGSYGGRPPHPPVKAKAGMKMDREKYGLGQKVYDGSVMTSGGGDADRQRARLETLQAKLPDDVSSTKKLVSLAGNLSEVQLDALEYFVEERFAMKK